MRENRRSNDLYKHSDNRPLVDVKKSWHMDEFAPIRGSYGVRTGLTLRKIGRVFLQNQPIAQLESTENRPFPVLCLYSNHPRTKKMPRTFPLCTRSVRERPVNVAPQASS